MDGMARWTGTAWASLLIACALVTLALPARAQDHVAEQDGASQVRAALTQWRDDFNAGEVEPLCDIFAPDLVVTYRGTPDRGYAAFCRQLQTAVADPALDLRYDLIPAGDLVVARVIWTLTSRVQGQSRKFKPSAASTSSGGRRTAHGGSPGSSPTTMRRS